MQRSYNNNKENTERTENKILQINVKMRRLKQIHIIDTIKGLFQFIFTQQSERKEFKEN